MRLMEKFFCYPPAETHLPLGSYFQALLPFQVRFALDLEKHLGIDTCVVAGSGRTLLADLLNLLKQADIDERNEVLIPGYTCYSVAAAVAHSGLLIRVYDVDPATFAPDMASLKQSLSEKTLAVIGQHLFGIPAPMSEVLEITHSFGAILVDDAAQGLGGSLGGRALGTLGDFGLLSFGRGKPMPLGCGGAMICPNQDTAARFPGYAETNGTKDFLLSLAVRVLSNPMIYGIMERLPLGLGKTKFDPGFCSRGMPAVMQRLGSRMLRGFNTVLEHRRLCAERYLDLLGEKRAVKVLPQAEAVYTRFPVLANAGEIPHDLYRLGVRRMYPHAVLDEPAIKPYLARQNNHTPGAARIARDLITLPTHLGISKQRAEQLASRVREVLAW
jgi:perosamine synthetase